MSKKMELEIFCDELSVGEVNKVDYVRKQLRVKYLNNTDMYLIIKAEAQESDYMQYASVKVCILSLIVSSISTIMGLIPNIQNIVFNSTLNSIALLIIMCMYVKIGMSSRFSSVGKWRKYILVVIDDLIQESKNCELEDSEKKKKKHKKDNKKKV